MTLRQEPWVVDKLAQPLRFEIRHRLLGHHDRILCIPFTM